MPYHEAKFNYRLQQFMQTPMNPDFEKQFAAALLKMEFYAPVQMVKRSASIKNANPALSMVLAITTYLADGKRYIPVFSDEKKMQVYLQRTSKMDFRPFKFTVSELMLEVKHLKANGILINPGDQSFPLTNDYWQYIHQVAPVVINPDEDEVHLQILHPEPVKLQRALIATLRHMRKVRRAWLIGVRLNDQTRYDYSIVVDYEGKQAQFQNKVARKLAVAAHRYLPHGTDLLVGAKNEPLAQQIASEIDPFYVRSNIFN